MLTDFPSYNVDVARQKCLRLVGQIQQMYGSTYVLPWSLWVQFNAQNYRLMS